MLAASPLAAASVKIWVCDSASEFSAGEARGVSVSADGTLYADRSLEKVEGVAEAVLFAAAEGKGGDLFVGTGDSAASCASRAAARSRCTPRCPSRR
jgi:hypothetical protein